MQDASTTSVLCNGYQEQVERKHTAVNLLTQSGDQAGAEPFPEVMT